MLTPLKSNTASTVISSRMHFTSRASMFPVSVRSVTVVFSVDVNSVVNVPEVVTLMVLETADNNVVSNANTKIDNNFFINNFILKVNCF